MQTYIDDLARNMPDLLPERQYVVFPKQAERINVSPTRWTELGINSTRKAKNVFIVSGCNNRILLLLVPF